MGDTIKGHPRVRELCEIAFLVIAVERKRFLFRVIVRNAVELPHGELHSRWSVGPCRLNDLRRPPIRDFGISGCRGGSEGEVFLAVCYAETEYPEPDGGVTMRLRLRGVDGETKLRMAGICRHVRLRLWQ